MILFQKISYFLANSKLLTHKRIMTGIGTQDQKLRIDGFCHRNRGSRIDQQIF